MGGDRMHIVSVLAVGAFAHRDAESEAAHGGQLCTRFGLDLSTILHSWQDAIANMNSSLIISKCSGKA